MNINITRFGVYFDKNVELDKITSQEVLTLYGAIAEL
jgi:hypothetical protein